MKYAFILGSNAYIANQGSITFFENSQSKEFLKIQSLYQSEPGDHAELNVQLAVKNLNGDDVFLFDDKSTAGADVKIDALPERITINNADGTTLIDVHQLNPDAYQHLSHHIVAELERYENIAVIRIFGHFMVGSHHIGIDSEKLLIDNESFAESVLIGRGGVQLRTDGVLL